MAAKKHHHRRSGRILAIVVASVVSCVVVLIGAYFWWSHKATRQKEFANWIKANDGSIRYDKPDKPAEGFQKWIVDKFGHDYAYELKGVYHNTWNKSSPISNLERFGDFPNLREVEIQVLDVEDWTPLSKLTKLEWLNLGSPEGSGPSAKIPAPGKDLVSQFAAFPDLQGFWLRDVHFPSAQPITQFAQLKFVRLYHTGIRDFDVLSRCSRIEYLEIEDAQLKSLEMLRGMPNLNRLVLPKCQVPDYSPLASCTALKELDLTGSSITDLTPLKNLQQLESLMLDETAVQDLTPLSACRSLSHLYLNKTKVQNLQPLACLSGLQSLNLEYTPVRDLRPLAKFQSSSFLLSLQGTQVTDLAPLRKTSISSLSLEETPIERLEPLQGVSGLSFLYLSKKLFDQYGEEKLQEMFPGCESKIGDVPEPMAAVDE